MANENTTAPESTPTAPESTPTTPESTSDQPVTAPETTPKDTETTPESTPTTPSVTVPLSELSGLIEQTVKALLKDSKADPEFTSDQSVTAPETPLTSPETIQDDTQNEIIKDLLIRAYGVPDELKGLIPKGVKEASDFLGSESYSNLVKRLNYTPKEPPKETPEVKTTEGEKAPETKTPKTFQDADLLDILGEALKGVMK